MKQVLYFSAKWCTACQATTPLIESLKKNNPQNVRMVDVDYEASLTEQYNVRSVPTTVILENGNEISRVVGVLDSNRLNNLING